MNKWLLILIAIIIIIIIIILSGVVDLTLFNTPIDYTSSGGPPPTPPVG